MNKVLAGTELSALAVHTIIELGYGTVNKATELGALLRLEKSSVSRLVQKLKKEEFIKVDSLPDDKRSHILTLTPKGKSLLSDVGKVCATTTSVCVST